MATWQDFEEKEKEKEGYAAGYEYYDESGYPISGSKLRLGRRDTQPHSEQVEYITSVLNANFPMSHAFSDLHHYFNIASTNNRIIHILPDISFFEDFKLDFLLYNYKSSAHNNRIPLVIINLMSRSTWRKDIGFVVDKCRSIKVPFYIIFSMYKLKVDDYDPPFLRIYEYNASIDNYRIYEIRDYAKEEGKLEINEDYLYSHKSLPFRVGLEKLKIGTPDTKNLARLLLVKKEKLEELITPTELEKKRAEEAEKRAEEQRKRAKKAEQQIKILEKMLKDKKV